jgi:hypothetical protein
VNGNDIVFLVLAGSVNGGVAYITEFVLLQLPDCRGPVKMN